METPPTNKTKRGQTEICRNARATGPKGKKKQHRRLRLPTCRSRYGSFYICIEFFSIKKNAFGSWLKIARLAP
jgi:hypothetical protein